MLNQAIYPMKIAILGTRGIPNQYGGFEQFAEYLAVGLKERGHQVGVYLPHFHPNQGETYKGVSLHRIQSPERFLGAFANFIYDYSSLKDAIRRRYDIILECGYGTSAPSLFLARTSQSIVITNMDGLEWKRSKWSLPVQRFTRWLESIAVKHSDVLVADNVGIQAYLKAVYGVNSICIPYGSEVIEVPSTEGLEIYQLFPQSYHLAIARLEPENNLEMLLDGFRLAQCDQPLLIVGNHQTAYGRYLCNKYKEVPGIRFLGGIYQKGILDSLRHYARIYFHGHSVGGTNPSLLEAMGCGALVASHNNEFNRSVLLDQALYFTNALEVVRILRMELTEEHQSFRKANKERIRSTYNWSMIIGQYESLFSQSLALFSKASKTTKA